MADAIKKEQDDWQRRQNILNNIKRLTAKKTDLEIKKTKIEEAMSKVQTYSSSEKISGAATSYNWIVNNMDTYWSATDSIARETVKDTLTKVSNECGSSGKVMSQVGPVMEAAAKKLEEIKKEIEEINAQIAVLKSELSQEEK